MVVKFSVYLNRRVFVMCHYLFLISPVGATVWLCLVLRDFDISWVSSLIFSNVMLLIVSKGNAKYFFFEKIECHLLQIC